MNHQCSDSYLEIHENNKGKERKCGYVREAGSIFGSGAKKLTLTFVTNDAARQHDNGFWLEVLGKLNLFSCTLIPCKVTHGIKKFNLNFLRI
jgi:hypothetical protein